MEPGEPSTKTTSERIIAALLSDRGIKHLVDEAADALGNPIVVVDPSYHYVASGGVTPAADDDSAYARVMREEMAFGDILEDGVAYIEDDGINERLARSRGPVVRDNANLGLTTMTQNVVVHGICLARVMMMAHERPFAECDVADFSLLCNVVGQELQKGEVFTVGSAQMESYFLRRLLEDEQPTPQATARPWDCWGSSRCLRSSSWCCAMRRAGPSAPATRRACAPSSSRCWSKASRPPTAETS